MMKKTTFLAGMAFFSLSSVAYAQTGRVGINTTTPASTLDVSGQRDTNGNLLTTDITGLQAPRLTLTELSAKPSSIYGANQKGALIYITSATPAEITAAATAANNAQTSNITAEGYYYFDGTSWKIVSTGLSGEADGIIGNEIAGETTNMGLTKSGTGTTADPYTLGLTAGSTAGDVFVWNGSAWAPKAYPNIYTSNGTLAANRTVTQDANTLAFTATSTNAFSVDGTTFSVDAANNRIGLGTAAPSTRLHINNATAGAIRIVDGTQALGRVLTSDANGVATWVDKADGIVGNEVTDAALNGGLARTGTGTALDPYKLKVMDGTAADQALTWNATTNTWAPALATDWKLTGNAGTTAGTHFIGTTDNIDFVVKTTNTERLRIKNTGEVGIGTNAPTGKLDIKGIGGTGGVYGAAFSSGTNGDATLEFYGMAAGIFSRISAEGPLLFYSVGRDTAAATSDMQIQQGGVAIGTDTLSGVPLEVNNGTTAGAVKIVDGTQGLNKVLTSDANGLATWQNQVPLPIGKFGGKEDNTVINMDGNWRYLNWYIDLPANKTFFIEWTMQVGSNGTNANGWLHFITVLSSSTGGPDNTGLQLLSNPNSYGTLTSSWGNSIPQYFGQIRGAHVIKNTTGSTKRLYLVGKQWGSNQGSPQLNPSFGENAIIAYEVN